MPLVPGRDSAETAHVLFRCLRPRVEAANRSRLHARKSIAARCRRVREMRYQYDFFTTGHAAAGFCGQKKISERVGTDGAQPEIALGRGSHRAGSGRRRAVRSREHAHAVFEMPQRSDSSAARSAQKSYFLKSRSKASRASMAFLGAGELMPGIA